MRAERSAKWGQPERRRNTIGHPYMPVRTGAGGSSLLLLFRVPVVRVREGARVFSARGGTEQPPGADRTGQSALRKRPPQGRRPDRTGLWTRGVAIGTMGWWGSDRRRLCLVCTYVGVGRALPLAIDASGPAALAHRICRCPHAFMPARFALNRLTPAFLPPICAPLWSAPGLWRFT